MSAGFLQLLTDAVFVVVFVAACARAIEHPTRAHVNIAVLFGLLSLFVLHRLAIGLFDLDPDHPANRLSSVLALAVPYWLLRLAGDFSQVPAAVMRGAELGLALIALALALLEPPVPGVVALCVVAYFFGFSLYAAAAFWTQGRRSSGVTRRRMVAVSCGSGLLAMAVVLGGIGYAIFDSSQSATVPVQLFALSSAIAHYLGFAPPAFLRRWWQEPELREFFGHTRDLLRLQDKWRLIRELERGAAKAVGGAKAVITLADEPGQVLRFKLGDRMVERSVKEAVTGRVFLEQRPFFTRDLLREQPRSASFFRHFGVSAMIAAPVSIADTRIGVLAVFSARTPVFAEDDLALVEMLADQAALVLECQALIEDAVRIRARDEAAQAKEDFLSAAAHDLRTPLTAISLEAQALEREMARRPEVAPKLKSIQRIVAASKRMQALLGQLLEAAGAQAADTLDCRAVDLAEIAHAARDSLEIGDRCAISAPAPLIGHYDAGRMAQLFENLMQNAAKYSPAGSRIDVKVWQDDGKARISVSDEGMGIPAEELPRIFDRFYRASNADPKQIRGLGLGLFICRTIVERQGGRIWASSTLGSGTTLQVSLPLEQQPQSFTAQLGVTRQGEQFPGIHEVVGDGAVRLEALEKGKNSQ